MALENFNGFNGRKMSSYTSLGDLTQEQKEEFLKSGSVFGFGNTEKRGQLQNISIPVKDLLSEEVSVLKGHGMESISLIDFTLGEFEVETMPEFQKGKDIWIDPQTNKVKAKAGWYQVNACFYVDNESESTVLKDGTLQIVFGVLTNNEEHSGWFNYCDYEMIPFDCSYHNIQTKNISTAVLVQNDGDEIRFAVSTPDGNPDAGIEYYMDYFSIHRIASVVSGGGSGKGMDNVFIGDIDTTFAEWKEASDAGKALMFTYSMTNERKEETVVFNPAQTKVTVLPGGVIIGARFDVMDEGFYVEIMLAHDQFEDVDNIKFSYFGMLTMNMGTLQIRSDGRFDVSFIGLLALPNVTPEDLINGNFNQEDYTMSELYTAMLLGYVKMRTEFDWMLVYRDTEIYTNEIFYPVKGDTLIGEDESSACLCSNYVGWSENSEVPALVKYRRIQPRMINTYEGEEPTETLTFEVTPVYFQFESDLEE